MHDPLALGGNEDVAPLVWSLWHYQVTTEASGEEDWDLPHLLLGYFARSTHAEEALRRLRARPGLCDWPAGFRVWREPLDGGGAWQQGFVNPWDDEDAEIDRSDVHRLPEPTPAVVPKVVWDVQHFRLSDPHAPPDPGSVKGIGLYSCLANATSAIAHRRRQPGFRDWPDGFRCYRRRLGVVFGLDGFRERYGWEAWRDSIIGGAEAS